jgi:ribosomal protein L2
MGTVLPPISLNIYCRNNQTIEYDPNRNAYIWFIREWHGKKRFLLQTREGPSKS